MNIFISLFLPVFALGIFSHKDVDPVKWSFDINQVGEKEYELIFKADIDKPWVIYSQDISDGGPIPTSINYTSDNVIPVNKAIEIGDRKELMDEMFEMKLIKYSYKKPYYLKHKVTVNDISKPVTGYITYMVCNDKVCLPPRDADFSFTIKVINPLQKTDDGKSISIQRKSF